MQATRRYWTTVAVAAFLAAASVVLARPLLLFGAAGLAAWLLTAQYAFLTAVSRAVDDVKVGQVPARDRVAAESDAAVTLTVASVEESSLALSVTARPPVAAVVPPRERRTVTPGADGTATTTFDVEWPVAGRHEFEQARLEAADAFGLFKTAAPVGNEPTVVVEPHAPRNIHVGEGGEPWAGIGEHESDRQGSGLDPAELREYLPSDPAKRIDWKATARLQETYVREFEAETELETVLLVDHRAAMATGTDGQRKLDYGRQVALAFVNSALALDDPLGYYGVGDGGLTTTQSPTTAAGSLAEVRRTLVGLEPTGQATSTDVGDGRGPARAHVAARVLSEDETAFGETLRPFFDDAGTYVDAVADRPLYRAAERLLASRRSHARLVVVSDDTERAELREAVRLATRYSPRVLVFLTPTVLFEPGGLGDLETAYQRYVDFEEYRRKLDRIDGVTAFEVAPSDRLGAVLEAGERRRGVRGLT